MGDPPSVGEALCGEGEPEAVLGLAEAVDGLADAEEGLADAVDGLAEALEGLADDGLDDAEAEVGTGGGGCCLGAFWNNKIATHTARHMSSIIRAHDAKIDSQPDLSERPGHGSDQSLQRPGFDSSTQ